MQTSRRDVLTMAALWAQALTAAQSHRHAWPSTAQAPHTLRFFTKPERETVSNLFVHDAGAFVTAGNQNPTITILALALRSSERIVEMMKRREL